MAAKQPRLGLRHVTVVPTNFREAEQVDAAEATVARETDGEGQ